MKFRNFDKIGLTTEEQIREFLSEQWVKVLAKEEEFRNKYVKNGLHDMGFEAEVNNEIIVTLLNKESNTGMPLICIVQHTLYNNRIYCTFDTSDGLIRMCQLPRFNTVNEAVEFTDKLYGATSNDDVSEKVDVLKRESEAE